MRMRTHEQSDRKTEGFERLVQESRDKVKRKEGSIFRNEDKTRTTQEQTYMFNAFEETDIVELKKKKNSKKYNQREIGSVYGFNCVSLKLYFLNVQLYLTIFLLL